MTDEFVVVPVLEKFDQSKQIGELRILKSKLPPTADFVFSLGYVKSVDTFELLCVSMMSDGQYLAYMESNSAGIY